MVHICFRSSYPAKVSPHFMGHPRNPQPVPTLVPVAPPGHTLIHTGFGSNHPTQAPLVLSTPRHISLHSLQLQLSSQHALCAEGPRTNVVHVHFSYNFPARGPSMQNVPGPISLCPTSHSAIPPKFPWNRAPHQPLDGPSPCFQPSCQVAFYMKSPRTLAYPHVSLSCPARVSSVQRAPGLP